jgi:DNA-binding response OmpR family regulator
VIDPSPEASTLTTPPIVAAGCRAKTVASMSEALDAARGFAPVLLLADAGAERPPESRKAEAARLLAQVPLTMLATPKTPSEVLESWAGVGAADLVMRPLRLLDVQLRLAAAKTAPRPDPKHLRRVLLASDDPVDLGRLDAQLQLNGFFVLPLALTNRTVVVREQFDVLLLALRSSGANEVLQQLRRRHGVEQLPAVVLTPGGDLPPQAHLHACLDINTSPDEVMRVVSGERRVHSQLRVHQRVTFFAPVEFRESGNGTGRWLAGYSSNLSPGGLFIRSLAVGRVGSVLDLRVHLMHGPQHEVLEGSGAIAWANGWGARTGFHFSIGMGIQLIGMSAAMLSRIAELCEAHH